MTEPTQDTGEFESPTYPMREVVKDFLVGAAAITGFFALVGLVGLVLWFIGDHPLMWWLPVLVGVWFVGAVLRGDS